MGSLLTNLFRGKNDLMLVLAMIGILIILFSPIPAAVLDLLLITNFSLALLILLLTFYTEKPLAFSTFPSLLLITTLFRLALNISATRLILNDADAGQVIGAIGTFVVAGNYVIGLVVFLILVVVQYVVVTNGAQRVAEVAARFTLDSMPGKQMSIDADMNMGIIDEKEAKQRRANVEKEANFYGAMDGATKFVKGDAIAGIIIILIDIIGGLSVGVAQHGMGWGEALHTFTLLTVGDGIVTQIPSLIVATATGIIITRAATDSQLGEEVIKQIMSQPKTLAIVSGALLLVAFLPNIPLWPVLLLLLLFGSATFFAIRNKNAAAQAQEQDALDVSDQQEDKDTLYQLAQIHPVEIGLGPNLATFFEKHKEDIVERLGSFRKQYALEYGFVLPEVSFNNRTALEQDGYSIEFHGAVVGDGVIRSGKSLAINPGGQRASVEGETTREPSYGLAAVWIEKTQAKHVAQLGYTIVDEITLFVTHFTEMVRRNAHELLTRRELEAILNRAKVEYHALLEELVPNQLSYSELQRVLQNLLKEKVPIRHLELILESLIEHSKQTKSVYQLTEVVRARLNKIIYKRLADKAGVLHVITLEPSLELKFANSVNKEHPEQSMLAEAGLTEQFLTSLLKNCEKMMMDNKQPVLLCSTSIRYQIRKMTERLLPHMSVVSVDEIPLNAEVRSFATLKV